MPPFILRKKAKGYTIEDNVMRIIIGIGSSSSAVRALIEAAILPKKVQSPITRPENSGGNSVA